MPTIYRDKVVLNGLTFNDPTSPFRMDLMDGWGSTVDLDVVVSARGNSDGGVWGSRFPAKEKYIILGGYCLAPTRSEAASRWDQLVRAFRRNDELLLQRYEPIPKQMKVKLASRIEPEVGGDYGEAFRFTATVVAEDPFKYSVEETATAAIGISAGGVAGRSYPRTYPLTYTAIEGADDFATFNNLGTADTAPLSRIIGPLPPGSWRILNDTTGSSLAFNIGILEGQILEIDHREHEAFLNGFPVTSKKSGEWWRLVPGVNKLRLMAGDYNPTASYTAIARSAWE